MIAHNTNLIMVLLMEKGDTQRRFTVPQRDTAIVQAAGIVLSVLWYIGVAAVVLGREHATSKVVKFIAFHTVSLCCVTQ